MDFIFGYQESKIKPHLKMASQRLVMAQNKKRNSVKTQKREIGILLSQKKEESARIKIEHIIREDYTIECYELIQLFCDLVLERIRLISHDEKCPHDLIGPISTLIWVADRIEIDELLVVKNQLYYKYGSAFVKAAQDNEHLMVNDKVIKKLSIHPPTAYLVQEYLKEIAKEYNIPWTPAFNILPDDLGHVLPPSGFKNDRAPGTGIPMKRDDSTSTSIPLHPPPFASTSARYFEKEDGSTTFPSAEVKVSTVHDTSAEGYPIHHQQSPPPSYSEVVYPTTTTTTTTEPRHDSHELQKKDDEPQAPMDDLAARLAALKKSSK